MRSFPVLALMAYLACASSEEVKPRRVSKESPCRIKPEIMPENKVHTPLKEVDVPDEWLWNDIRGANLLTTIRQ